MSKLSIDNSIKNAHAGQLIFCFGGGQHPSRTVAASNFRSMHPFNRLSKIYFLDFAIHKGRKETNLKDAL